MKVKGTVNVKKKAGCFTRIIQVLIVFIIIAAFAGMNSDKTNTPSSGVTTRPTNTAKSTATVTAYPTHEPTSEPIKEPDYSTIASEFEKMMKDSGTVSYVKVETDESGFYVGYAFDGLSEDLSNIKLYGDGEENEDYKRFKNLALNMYDATYEYITNKGAHPEVVMINIVNDKNHNNTMMTIVNGVLFYDAMTE